MLKQIHYSGPYQLYLTALAEVPISILDNTHGGFQIFNMYDIYSDEDFWKACGC